VDGAVVVVLVLVWTIVLLPGAVRSRRSSTQVTVGGFERAMDVLRTRPAGRELLVPGDAGRIVTTERHAGETPGPYEAREPYEERESYAREIHPSSREYAVYDEVAVHEGDVAVVHGGPTDRERRRRQVIAQRRQAFTQAAAAALGLIVLAVVLGGALLWTLATLATIGATGYTAMLRRWKLQRDEATAVVRTIRTTDRRTESVPSRMAHAVGETPMFGDHLQVATRPDEPWQGSAGVRIRRWED